jgi:mono/diheme cytochrome c family protein
MNMPGIIRALLVIAAILVLASPEDAKADAARGQGLAEQWCSQCHGVRPSQPSANSDAPSFSAIAAEPSATQYALRTFLRVPHPTMPNFILKPDDIDDIVGYITSLKPQK